MICCTGVCFVINCSPLTIALQRQLDVTQGPSILQQVGGCIRQDIVGLGGFEEELQLHAMLP